MEYLIQGGTKESNKGRITFFQSSEEYKTSDQSFFIIVSVFYGDRFTKEN